jgi:hypothetical protein
VSYDLQIWSVRPVQLPEDLPDPEAWTCQSDYWIREGRDWQILLSGSIKVEPEDVPQGVHNALPGIGFFVEMHVHLWNVVSRVQRICEKTATALAKAAHGIVFDPQTDTMRMPSGVKRLMPLERGESASLLSLSWWFERGRLAEDAEAEELVEVLEANLPEALPRRYGACEPPELVFAEAGKEGFCTYVRDVVRRSMIVWYPHPPVANVYLSIPKRVGATRQGYRSARFSIDIDAAVLGQPGWEVALRRAWRRISSLIRPFYGDVRTFQGYQRKGNRYWVAPGVIQHHPVSSWWWNGIPQGPVHAVVVGEPYLGLWPEFASSAEFESGLAFASAPSWMIDQDSTCQVATIPETIAQPPMRYEGELRVPHRQYPSLWPFGITRLAD